MYFPQRDFFSHHTIQGVEPRLFSSSALKNIDEYVSFGRKIVHVQAEDGWTTHSLESQLPWKQTLAKIILLSMATFTIIPMAILLLLKASYQTDLHKILQLPIERTQDEVDEITTDEYEVTYIYDEYEVTCCEPVNLVSEFTKLSDDPINVIASFLKPKEIISTFESIKIFRENLNKEKLNKVIQKQLESKSATEMGLTGKQATQLAIRCPTLTSLNLSYCRDIDASDLALLAKHCPKLKNLDLSNISKRDPETYLFQIGITDEGLEQIIKLKELTHLNLRNSLNVSKPSLGLLKDLVNLTYLNLDFSDINDNDLEALSCLINLTYLGICGSKISDEGLKYLKDFVKLTHLDISCSLNIKGPGLAYIKDLTQLVHLNLRGVDFSPESDFLMHIKDLTNLTHLNLELSKIVDKDLEHLKLLKELTYLNLGRCRDITAIGLEHLTGLNKLTDLDLTFCKGINSNLPVLIEFKSLIKLTLHGLVLNDTFLARLKEMTNLKVLDLSKCLPFTSNSIKLLNALTNLSKLIFNRCGKELTYDHYRTLKSCPTREVLPNIGDNPYLLFRNNPRAWNYYIDQLSLDETFRHVS